MKAVVGEIIAITVKLISYSYAYVALGPALVIHIYDYAFSFGSILPSTSRLLTFRVGNTRSLTSSPSRRAASSNTL